MEIASTQHIKAEKEKARVLRKSRWWQNLISIGVCAYCENKFPASALTMDHVLPISRGGKTTKGNLRPSCKPCNSDKKSQTPWEWQSQ